MGTILRPTAVAQAEPFTLMNAVSNLVEPVKFKPESLLVLATPQYANELYAAVAESKSTYATFGAIVDVVPPGAKRDGISYLYTAKPITVEHGITLDRTRQHSSHGHTHSDGKTDLAARGRFVAKGGEQWTLSRMYLSLSFNSGDKSVKVQTANTIFETGVEGVIVAKQPGQNPVLYSRLDLAVPLDISFQPTDRKPPIKVLETAETLYVTSVKDNIIKTINGKPASSFLEASLAASLFLEQPPPMQHSLSAPPSGPDQKARSVYAVLDDSARWKVIAGGGGWGARSGMLVLDPDVTIREGAKIQFMATTGETSVSESEFAIGNGQMHRLYFECVAPIEFIDGSSNTTQEVTLDGVFGAGTENQFFVGRQKFDVHGEYCVACVE
ncbi:hypothetical protein V1512DRAFT_272607 [Lipomyces arxii]|uniref:uncharacterized protein n=1 Tax=Lipomyces arxii TaxID=56418 RepID=UPI0034CE8CA5